MRTKDLPPVKLKGVGDSFWVTVDPDASETIIHQETKELFNRLQHLAINAKVVIDVGGAEGCGDLINNLKHFIKSNFDVGSINLPQEKKSVPLAQNKPVDFDKGWLTHRSDALILTGRIRSGQKIETKRHLIIAGNVNPGAQLTSSGNIIVLGTLLGQVYAGYPDNEDAFVIALEYKPTQIQISGIMSVEFDASLSKKAVYASIDKNRIIVQDYMKSQPFGKIPWPTAI